MGRAAHGLLKAAFFAVALPAVARAAVRVLWLERLAMDETARRLRDVRPFRLTWLRQPVLMLGTVERLLWVLPPWSAGPCLRRSLVLLDLWSRCGLEPRLHLNFKAGGGHERLGHAWVTAASAGGRVFATASQGYPEAFEL